MQQTNSIFYKENLRGGGLYSLINLFFSLAVVLMILYYGTISKFWPVVILSILLVAAEACRFFLQKINITYTDEGVQIKTLPFQTQKSFSWRDVLKAKKVTFLFPGWLSFVTLWQRNSFYGSCPNGFIFYLKNGTMLKIGSGKPEEVDSILSNIFSHK
ncbi:MAG: hypothetical protein RMJ53_08065 [Chitinophagales bacterium]|nr:hypothetical protein [Chitinophagales bacterium]MDW8274167.1 hypothetical protein [Chitinophagales bacterium]